MEIKYNKTKPTVLEGLEVSNENFIKIVKDLHIEGLSNNDALDIVFKADLSLETILAIVFEVGANFGQQVLVQKLTEQTLKEQDIRLAGLAKEGNLTIN